MTQNKMMDKINNNENTNKNHLNDFYKFANIN